MCILKCNANSIQLLMRTNERKDTNKKYIIPIMPRLNRKSIL